MSDYCVLEFPAEFEDYREVEAVAGFEDLEGVRQGRSQAEHADERFVMTYAADDSRPLPDFVYNTSRLLIISARFKHFLETHEVSHVEYYALKGLDIEDGAYYVAHLIDPVECIDVDASKAKWATTGDAPKRIRRLKKLVLDPAATPSDRKLFLPAYYRKYPLVRADLAGALKTKGFTNLEVVPIDECAC